jgi:hypothetical protein
MATLIRSMLVSPDLTPSVDFSHGPLRVSDNGRYLVHEDGAPFFYLGDTAWELFHRLSREDADSYLANRAAKRFTVIQAVVLAEFDGLGAPNAYGELPLIDLDPTKPSDAYFEHVDYIVDKAAELGLYTGMLPTWGDKWNKKWGGGPVVFNQENAGPYGEFLGARYRDKPVIWILGGDRNPEGEEHLAAIRAMAAGLGRGDGGAHLMTFHPMGGSSSAQWFHHDDWLDFNMLQSGHSRLNTPNYRMVAADYARTPAKPCVDGEPCYEDHPINWKAENGWFSDYDARKAAYWAVFAGAHGHTYGCHDIWQFLSDARPPVSAARTPWRTAIDLPGAGQVQHVRALIESRPFLNRVPDQSLLNSPEGDEGKHVQATRDADGAFAMIYLPKSEQRVTVDLGRLSGGAVRAWWFDPRTGTASALDGDFRGEGTHEFITPAGGPDWVLVLDDAARDFPPPGA